MRHDKHDTLAKALISLDEGHKYLPSVRILNTVTQYVDGDLLFTGILVSIFYSDSCVVI